MTIHNPGLIHIAAQGCSDAAATLVCGGNSTDGPHAEGHIEGAEQLACKVLAVLALARREPIETTIDRVSQQMRAAAERLANPKTEHCAEHTPRPTLTVVPQDKTEQE